MLSSQNTYSNHKVLSNRLDSLQVCVLICSGNLLEASYAYFEHHLNKSSSAPVTQGPFIFSKLA